MTGSVNHADYRLSYRPGSPIPSEIQLIAGTVDGEEISAIAFWHVESLLWSVQLGAGSRTLVREVSTMVDACHAVRDMARERAGYVAPVRYPFEAVR